MRIARQYRGDAGPLLGRELGRRPPWQGEAQAGTWQYDLTRRAVLYGCPIGASETDESRGSGGCSSMAAEVLGRYIVADPEICHGKLTFRGTRIMVSQVLEQVANGMSWEAIIEEWRGS